MLSMLTLPCFPSLRKTHIFIKILIRSDVLQPRPKQIILKCIISFRFAFCIFIYCNFFPLSVVWWPRVLTELILPVPKPLQVPFIEG